MSAPFDTATAFPHAAVASTARSASERLRHGLRPGAVVPCFETVVEQLVGGQAVASGFNEEGGCETRELDGVGRAVAEARDGVAGGVDPRDLLAEPGLDGERRRVAAAVPGSVIGAGVAASRRRPSE